MQSMCALMPVQSSLFELNPFDIGMLRAVLMQWVTMQKHEISMK